MSKYETTFAEWDACVTAGTCPTASDGGWGREDRPVTNVSWEDAQNYADWLSRMTGQHYRLLSEAEWEYSARGGSNMAYSWGAEIGSGNANCDGCGSQWDKRQTAPVGSFKPNALGLYDMHGNVWEWVEDCWNSTYYGAPTDGSAWTAPHCSLHVLRGGSWSNGSQVLRTAFRGRITPVNRVDGIGFRLARMLNH